MINDDNKYTKMQKDFYDREASNWSIDKRNPVVGSFDAHNSWSGYRLLFEGLGDTSKSSMLDFGCGPGRNIVKYHDSFERIDGVDISQVNLDKARLWIEKNGKFKNQRLFLCNGVDLSCIDSEQYDIVMSTIALQHICVHDIRLNYFREFFRVLKQGGTFTAQMGFGSGKKESVNYYENFYDAKSTNSWCDVRVESPDQLKTSLQQCGFTNFSFVIDKVGPGDNHNNWIFFRATKL